MKFGSRIFTGFLAVLLILCIALTVFAQVPFVQEHRCVLVMDYFSEDLPIAGAEFKVYRVADLDQDLNMTLSGDFADCPVTLNGLDREALERTARVLASYAEDKHLAPGWGAVTDEQGRIQLSDLTVGVYLTVGSPIQIGDRVYYSLPQLIVLPQYDEQDADWDYAVSIRLKGIFIGSEEELLSLTVLKRWVDSGFEASRPEEITVHLLWNGKRYDTVRLSEENQWAYTWEGLLPVGQWTVEEEVPEGYVLEITRENNTFLLKNYHKNIPQTGQTWWPVPILLAVGLILMAWGIRKVRGKGHEET